MASRKFTSRRFANLLLEQTAALGRKPTVREIARARKLTPVTVYRYLSKIPSFKMLISDKKPGKVAKYDYRDFSRIISSLYQKLGHKPTIPDIMAEADLTDMSVRNYLKRYPALLNRIDGTRSLSTTRIKSVFDSYRGLYSLPDIANKYHCSETMVRYYLKEYIRRFWTASDSPVRHLPQPQTLQQIKVAHAMSEYTEIAAAIDAPPENYASSLNLPVPIIRDYIQRVFEHVTARQTHTAK